jgi:hypothetical protein
MTRNAPSPASAAAKGPARSPRGIRQASVGTTAGTPRLSLKAGGAFHLAEILRQVPGGRVQVGEEWLPFWLPCSGSVGRRDVTGKGGPGLLAWTVNDSERFNQLVRLGVDGITTGNLAILQALSR